MFAIRRRISQCFPGANEPNLGAIVEHVTAGIRTETRWYELVRNRPRTGPDITNCNRGTQGFEPLLSESADLIEPDVGSGHAVILGEDRAAKQPDQWDAEPMTYGTFGHVVGEVHRYHVSIAVRT